MIVPQDSKRPQDLPLDSPPPYEAIDQPVPGPSSPPLPPPAVPPKPEPPRSPGHSPRARSASSAPPPRHPSLTKSYFDIKEPPSSPPSSSSPSLPPSLSPPAARPSLTRPKSTNHLPHARSSPDPPQPKKSFWSFFSKDTTASPELITKAAVTERVQTILRDLVRPPTRSEIQSPPPHDRVLAGAREACAQYHLSLSDIIQERSIEGHTAVYWSIVNGPSLRRRKLAHTLVGFARPMKEDTYAEIRQACLVRNDQELFEQLRNVATDTGAGQANGVDVMLGVVGADKVSVQQQQMNGQDDFSVAIDIREFEKRMKVKGEVQVEWIARSRAWNLTFAAENKKWYIHLSLLDDSPQSFVDAQLLVLDGRAPPNPGRSRRGRASLRVPIHTNGNNELIALETPTPSVGGKNNKKTVKRDKSNTLSVCVDDLGDDVKAAIGRGVEKGAPYFSRNNNLHLRFEVSLRKHEENGGCIIC